MRVEGRLLTEDGEALGGWGVAATDEITGRPGLPRTTTERDGSFVLENARVIRTPPLTFWVYDGARLVTALEPDIGFSPEGEAQVDLVISVPPRPGYHLIGRVWDDAAGRGVAEAKVTASDRGGIYDEQTAIAGKRGLFLLRLGFVERRAPDVALAVDGAPVVHDPVKWDDFQVATPRVSLAWRVTGTVTDRATGKGAPDVRVEAWQEAERALGAAETTPAGAFELFIPRVRGQAEPPKPVFRLYRGVQLLETAAVAVEWGSDGSGAVRLEVGKREQALPAVYTIDGTVIDRRTRTGVPGLRVEAWDGADRTMLAVADTGAAGKFLVQLAAAADGTAPAVRFRVYREGQLLAQPDVPLSWSGTQASVFIEADVPQAPTAFRVAGRLIDKASRAGLAGLRIEAWDAAPRDGGAVGVAAVTGADGAFEVAFPAAAAPATALITGPARVVELDGPRTTLIEGNGDVALAPAATAQRTAVFAVPSAGPPALFFRIYAAERLVGTASPDISWTPEGIGTVVVETAAPAVRSQEVGLHELGESIAGTVARVHTELARYPTTMGAYVLDEIDLDMPVEMRVDELGQVRTKVVDATTPDKNVGQVRMKVRPVLGARQPLSDVADQPLSALGELGPPAIARLEARRIYSVEDLARAAASGAGRAALLELDLGVDLDALLAKAELLAFPGLPRAVREALVAAGVASLGAFAKHADPAALAAQLSGTLEQEIGKADVEAWQAAVKAALAVPKPTDTAG